MKQAGILNELPRRRRRRLAALVLAWVLLATPAVPGPPPGRGGPAVARLTIAAVPLDEADPGRRRIGDLLFLRGWALGSDDRRFGAISAIHAAEGFVTAISDSGDLLRFPLPRAAGESRVRIDPLQDVAGPGADKLNRDTEAMLVGGSRAWIAFERYNLVGRYRRSDWRAEAMARPPAIRRWRRNAGPEAMVRLADGRFLVFAEGPNDDDEYSEVALFDGDPAEPGTAATALRYRRQPGYRVTDAALLPDGRLLILNRRFVWYAGVSARLAVAPADALAEGGTLEGRVIAELRAPLTVDNMEALSVARERGRTIVRLASDDNYMRLQRTLLLEFALVEEASSRRRPGSR